MNNSKNFTTQQDKTSTPIWIYSWRTSSRLLSITNGSRAITPRACCFLLESNEMVQTNYTQATYREGRSLTSSSRKNPASCNVALSTPYSKRQLPRDCRTNVSLKMKVSSSTHNIRKETDDSSTRVFFDRFRMICWEYSKWSKPKSLCSPSRPIDCNQIDTMTARVKASASDIGLSKRANKRGKCKKFAVLISTFDTTSIYSQDKARESASFDSEE